MDFVEEESREAEEFYRLVGTRVMTNSFRNFYPRHNANMIVIKISDGDVCPLKTKWMFSTF